MSEQIDLIPAPAEPAQEPLPMAEPAQRGRIVPDMPAADYHALPALSASGAWTLAAECPALYWHSSPFNPKAVPPPSNRQMDIGTALHLAVLEPARLYERVRLIDADSYRTKAAKQARDDAYDDGLTPLLPQDIDLIATLRRTLLENELVADLLDGAATEVSCCWEMGGVPCKSRNDIVSRDGLALADIKASASAAPEFFRRQAYDAGHFLRSPWYRDGWARCSGKRADYWYVVVQREPPHLVTVARLDERATAWGEMMIGRALRLFRQCRERGSWPPWCTEPVTLSLPEWAEFRLADREQAGELSPISGADIRRAIKFLEP